MAELGVGMGQKCSGIERVSNGSGMRCSEKQRQRTAQGRDGLATKRNGYVRADSLWSGTAQNREGKAWRRIAWAMQRKRWQGEAKQCQGYGTPGLG